MTAYTVAIDDSAAGWQTLDWVGGELDPDHDRVRLLTVNAFRGEEPASSASRLEAAAERLRRGRPYLAVTYDLVGGPTVEAILANSEHGDVLVIGGQQLHRFLAAIAGRIAERVVARANIPVVIVPERWAPADGPIVVGVDSRTAASALGFAASIAVRKSRELLLVRAWEVPSTTSPYGVIYLEQDRDIWEHEADLELDAALRAVGVAHPDLSVRRIHHRGQPLRQLLAASDNSSLIVIGRRHRTALGGLLTGSVGEALMHFSHVPVCVVPPHATTTADAGMPSDASADAG
ncbi:universal stress protein [Curtobacterium sp. PhB115]|uniref:universal stress protein n=1 Tax=Curtobacterium sp. PhB115 TaxID=2485173 RepID=UPI000FBEF509|nr:universal stress protein [Curtobacterium sp. PhB115]ROP58685.1 nucleotide-binding universal stress UspA family protein [Curtobacterium sp. PhB115]